LLKIVSSRLRPGEQAATALKACVIAARSVPLWASNAARACAACRPGGSAGEDTAAGAGEDTAEGAGEDAGAAAGDTCPAGPLHIWPFHRRIRVLPSAMPTAQASLPERAVTPKRRASSPGSGLGTCVSRRCRSTAGSASWRWHLLSSRCSRPPRRCRQAWQPHPKASCLRGSGWVPASRRRRSTAGSACWRRCRCSRPLRRCWRRWRSRPRG
jgi:hypothetical protein